MFTDADKITKEMLTSLCKCHFWGPVSTKLVTVGHMVAVASMSS